MVIIGIDPGFAIVGYGVIEYTHCRFRVLGYGAITTDAATPTEERIKIVYDELSELLRRYRPDEMAIEELFFNSNHTTAITVAEARGVLLLAAAQAGVRIFEYTPLQVKQSVVGYGRADKKQVIAMTNSILGLEKGPKLDDTSDALAIAICHAHTGCSRLREFYNK